MKGLLSFFWFIAVVVFTVFTIILIQLFQGGETQTLMKFLVPYAVVIAAILASTSIFLSVDNANSIEIEKKQNEKETNIVLLNSLIDTLFLKTFALKNCFKELNLQEYKDNKDSQTLLYEKEYTKICDTLTFVFSHTAHTIDKLYDKELHYALDEKSQILLNRILANTNLLLSLKDDILSIQSSSHKDAAVFYEQLTKMNNLYTVYENTGMLLLKKLNPQNSIFLNDLENRK